MKPGIIIYANGDSEWIGGVYYARNVLYQLSINKNITSKYNLFAYTNEICKKSFENIENVKVIVAKGKGKLELLLAIIKNNIKYRYPGLKDIMGCKAISWIPDFQQECMSDMFPIEEVAARKDERNLIIKNNLPLILSSYDSLNSFHEHYKVDKTNVYVMHFVSYIEPEIREMSVSMETETLKKFGLKERKYVYIANQFWKHKNHIIVLKALQSMNRSDLVFVFTGKMSDYRNPEYIDELKTLFEPLEKAGIALNLGFIDRMSQLIIMKNAEFLIQPSLFEGWGTVVEDAKVLDKTILLSDIPVHREQMNDKCSLFDPYDEKALASLIIDEAKRDHIDDYTKGIKRMNKEAREYSKHFEYLLNGQEDII